MSHRGTSLQVLQVSADLAFRLEWVRKLALTEFKAVTLESTEHI
jgi:hypothetical protein